MTKGEKHEAIANQYYKELEEAKYKRIYKDVNFEILKPDKSSIKDFLKKRGFSSVSEYLNYYNEDDIF